MLLPTAYEHLSTYNDRDRCKLIILMSMSARMTHLICFSGSTPAATE